MTSKKNSLIKPKLTPKQETFCLEYLKDLNATQAAIRAGYSEKTARHIASQNLAKLNIQHQIQKLNNTRIKEVKVDANFVLDELHKLANSNVAEMFDDKGVLMHIKQMPEHIQKSIQSFDIEEEHKVDGAGEIVVTTKMIRVKLWSKDRAIENLGKHLRLFIEKVEHSNPDGTLQPQITVYLPANNREKK